MSGIKFVGTKTEQEYAKNRFNLYCKELSKLEILKSIRREMLIAEIEDSDPLEFLLEIKDMIDEMCKKIKKGTRTDV